MLPDEVGPSVAAAPGAALPQATAAAVALDAAAGVCVVWQCFAPGLLQLLRPLLLLLGW
jgi:hypothetical protein